MKLNKLASAVYLAAATAATITSCTGSTAGKGGTDRPEVTQWAGEEIADAKSYKITMESDTFYLTLSSSMQWLDKIGDYDIKPFQQTVISYAYNNSNASTDISDAISKFVNNYREFVEPDATTKVEVSTEPNPAINAWSVEVDGNFIELTATHISYQITNSSYMGGAHPNTTETPFTYIPERESAVTPATLFVPGSEATLQKVIESNLAAEYETTPDHLTDAGFMQNEIKPSTLVYFMDGSIVFHYNQYEIAPYSMGDIDVAVQPYEVRDILTPYFKKYFDVEK